MQAFFLDGFVGIIGAVVTIMFSYFITISSECKDVEFEDD